MNCIASDTECYILLWFGATRKWVWHFLVGKKLVVWSTVLNIEWYFHLLPNNHPKPQWLKTALSYNFWLCSYSFDYWLTKYMHSATRVTGLVGPKWLGIVLPVSWAASVSSSWPLFLCRLDKFSCMAMEGSIPEQWKTDNERSHEPHLSSRTLMASLLLCFVCQQMARPAQIQGGGVECHTAKKLMAITWFTTSGYTCQACRCTKGIISVKPHTHLAV